MESWAIPWGCPFLDHISSSINQHLSPTENMHGGRRREMNAPKLQMHNPLYTILRYIIVVEQRVCYARDTEEDNAGCGEEEGTDIGSLRGLGDGGVNGEEGCFLDHLAVGYKY